MNRLTRLTFILILSAAPLSGWAITIGQFNDFENGSVEDWRWGRSGFGGPEIDLGGPDGPNDSYLRIESFGGDDSPGTRMVFFNRDDWAGDYLASGPSAIRFDASNLGPNFAFEDMNIRIAFSSNTATLGSGRVVTTQSFPLTRGGGWQPLEFSLDPMVDLTAIAGSNIAEVMSTVSEVRILSSEAPSFLGDQFTARLGVDNIRFVAVPEPNVTWLTWAVFAICLRRIWVRPR